MGLVNEGVPLQKTMSRQHSTVQHLNTLLYALYLAHVVPNKGDHHGRCNEATSLDMSRAFSITPVCVAQKKAQFGP